MSNRKQPVTALSATLLECPFVRIGPVHPDIQAAFNLAAITAFSAAAILHVAACKVLSTISDQDEYRVPNGPDIITLASLAIRREFLFKDATLSPVLNDLIMAGGDAVGRFRSPAAHFAAVDVGDQAVRAVWRGADPRRYYTDNRGVTAPPKYQSTEMIAGRMKDVCNSVLSEQWPHFDELLAAVTAEAVRASVARYPGRRRVGGTKCKMPSVEVMVLAMALDDPLSVVGRSTREVGNKVGFSHTAVSNAKTYRAAQKVNIDEMRDRAERHTGMTLPDLMRNELDAILDRDDGDGECKVD